MNYERIAEYYDRYVKWDADIPFFIKETGKTSGDVLELMSGTGRVSLPLIEKGVRLTCVDSSPAMLNILKNKLEKQELSTPVFQQNICELKLDKQYDLIFIPFHSFAEIVSTNDQLTALGKIRDHLSNSGRFICTLHNPEVRLKGVTNQLQLISRDRSEKSTLLVWTAGNYNPVSRLVEGIQLYEEYNNEGIMTSKIMSELKFCLLEISQFENTAASSGFKITHLYGDYCYSDFNEKSSPVMIFELQR